MSDIRMYLNKPESKVIKPCPLSSVLWRMLFFLSFLMLLFYVGVRLPM
jgi:hypothetical protein